MGKQSTNVLFNVNLDMVISLKEEEQHFLIAFAKSLLILAEGKK